ncbi:MAG: alpha/beta hydrolase [Longimicrobiales bacterium]
MIRPPSAHGHSDEERPWSRRAFVMSLVAMPGALRPLHREQRTRAGVSPDRTGRPALTHTRNPRLTARPGRPFRSVTPGQARIGEGLERGGYLFVPQSYREDTPAPLIVALHGGGGHAGRWSDLHASCERNGVVLAAPDSRARTWDRVTGGFGPDVAFIDALLRYTFERCAIDPTRVALVGFSDGASYTLSLGPSNGDLFTHLMAWSPGFSDPEEPIVGQPRVLISHGSEDSVLPVRLTRSGLVPMFEMDGYDVTYLEFVGRHELTDEIVQRSFEWFLAG